MKTTRTPQKSRFLSSSGGQQRSGMPAAAFLPCHQHVIHCRLQWYWCLACEWSAQSSACDPLWITLTLLSSLQVVLISHCAGTGLYWKATSCSIYPIWAGAFTKRNMFYEWWVLKMITEAQLKRSSRNEWVYVSLDGKRQMHKQFTGLWILENLSLMQKLMLSQVVWINGCKLQPYN